MKKRLISIALILAITLSLIFAGVATNAVQVGDLSQPTATQYRFNGHWVTDRGSFEMNLPDWSLATFTDEPAIITSGSAGRGLSYCRDLGEQWYAQVTVKLESDDTAAIEIGYSEPLQVELKTAGGNLTLTIRHGGATLLEKNAGNTNGAVTVLLDNTLGGKLALYLYEGQRYLGGWMLSELSASAQQLLKNAGCIGFYATKEGTVFTDFGVNDMIYNYSDNPEKALELVESWAKAEVEGSIVIADNGVPMYTPDGVKNYNALWTRDFTYMLEYAGDYIPVENAVACIEYLLEHVHEGDCWLPDRVYSNGAVNYAAGDMDYSRRNLDNNSFIVIALDCAMSRLDEAEAKALFEKWETTLMTALDSLPKDDKGLIYNDPQNPHSPYGFTDCICKTGSLMKESLLLWRAYCIMAKWQDAFGYDSSVATVGAQRIESALVDTFANADGMLDAATVDCHQTDIWGSCYAISIGFPMEESVKKSISDYIAANYAELVQMGQLRHTAPGEYWDRLLGQVNEGEYQNGAFWATPTGWLVDALVDYHPDLAMATIQDIITYFEEKGIYECVNGDYVKLIHYAASASNILPAARKLLTVSCDLESLTMTGDTAAVVGATKTYSVAVNPAETLIASYAWTVNGNAAEGNAQLTMTYAAAGTYEIACAVTDINGNTLTASTTVVVTDPSYRDVTVSVDPIVGKQGDTVQVAFALNEGAMMVSGDLVISYDPALMSCVSIAAGADWKGVFAGAQVEDGTIKASMATAKPVADQAQILVVTFTLLQDVEEAVYVSATSNNLMVNYLDDSGLHKVALNFFQIAPPQPEEPPTPDAPPPTADNTVLLGAVIVLLISCAAVAVICTKKRYA